MLRSLIQPLNNFFLDPLGLAVLLALIPLIIFYLMRPSPEEKIMPSMKFFQQEKKSGRLQKALNILQRNMMLLLHILMVSGFAIAIANPYIMGEERSENAVIVIDNSASMKPVFGGVKQEAISKIGHSNTVILANDETEVLTQKTSALDTERIIKALEVEETGTNIVRAVQRAQNYEGKLFLTTDFQQTVEKDTDINNLLKSISASRPLETFNPSKNNAWGIVDIDIGEENATALIQNYMSNNSNLGLEIGGDTRNVNLDPGELRELSFTIEEGRNTLSLEDDGFKVDNNAYIFRPFGQKTKVTVIADEKNRYLMKALELVENVDPEYIQPSDSLPDSDVYVIGRTEFLRDINTKKIVSEVQQGNGLILYGQQGAADISPEIPVNSVGSVYNTTVGVSDPVEVETGNITILESQVNGESVSTPKEALKFAEMGDGEFIYFNFGSSEFRESLDYPVFWKQLIERAAGSSSSDELNLETGSTVLTEQGLVELTDTGFREMDGTTYASNLLNGDESRFEGFEAGDYSSAKTVQQPQSLQIVPIILLMILGMGEMLYLYRRGEIP